mmetsp:Transcript_52738/g.80032  ORF Transcript_52738/g.80032 Transcript_52738/m.80032 type:complete len:173 (-) Transcript_52738:58-576(-)
MTLPDENTGVVDRLGQPLFVDLGLKTAFQQLLGGKLKNGIEFKFIVSEQTVTTHSSQQSGTLEDPLGILGVKGQKGTRCLTKLGKRILNTPDFALAAESVLSNKSQLGIQTFLLVRSARSLECLSVVTVNGVSGHDSREFLLTTPEDINEIRLMIRSSLMITMGVVGLTVGL